jgi:hypothetical protein
MEEITKDPSGVLAELASGDAQEMHSDSPSKASGKDLVSYDTYRKTVSQVKSLQAKLAELNEKTQNLEHEKLTAEGKKDELAESYKKKYEEERSKRTTQLRAFADEIMFRQFESEAAKLGCIKPDDLFTLYRSRLQEMEVNEDLKIDQGEVRQIIEDAKRERPFYFKKDSPRLATDIPGDLPKQKTKSLKDMSIEELKAQYRQVASRTQQ